ncbi:reverse transcriptase domain-containing protein [Tanacetum coccineum]
MTGTLLSGGTDGDGETPPVTREEIEGHISALRSLVKEHNKKNAFDPIRLDFDEEDAENERTRIVKGKTMEDANLKKPFKEALKALLTHKIIEFTSPEIKWHYNGEARRGDNQNAYKGRGNYTSYKYRDQRAPYPPPRRDYQGRAAPMLTLDFLAKPPKEILATKTQLRLPPPQLMNNPNRTGNMDHYCDYRQDKGHHINDCIQLKRQLEMALESGKPETEKKRKTRDSVESWMNVPITFPPVSEVDISIEPIIVEAEVEGFLENKDEYKWTEEAEAAFQEMKKLIMDLPFLITPLPKETLYVYLATSREVVSVVLLMENKGKQFPIHYVSRTLNEVKRNYAPMENLAFSLLHASRWLRRYFDAHPIKGQVLADFLFETPRGESVESFFRTPEVMLERDETEPWTLFTYGASSTKEDEVVQKVDDVSLADGFFNGAFGRDGDDDFMRRLGWKPWEQKFEESCCENDEDNEGNEYLIKKMLIKEVRHGIVSFGFQKVFKKMQKCS